MSTPSTVSKHVSYAKTPDPDETRRQRHALLFDAISEMVVLIRREADGGYRCLEANPAVSRMEGIPLEAILGKRVDEIHPPEVYAHWKSIYDQVVETGQPLEVEHTVHSPLGLRHRITKFFPLPGDLEGTCLLLGVCRDVTEAKAAALERDDHLRHLEALNRISGILAQDLDLENVLQEVTRALAEIFSADRAWLADSCDPNAPAFTIPFITSMPDFPGPPPGSRVEMDPVSRRIVREVIACEGPAVYDESHPMPGGEDYLRMFGIRSQMLMALRIREGETWCVGLHQCGYERRWDERDRKLFHDIGNRLKVSVRNLLLHRDLRVSREFYHMVTEVLPQLLWTADASGTVDFVNRQWIEYTGLSREESRGEGGIRAIHPDDVEMGVLAWRKSLASGAPFQVEQRYRRKDGEYRWHLTRAYPLKDAEGRITRWLGTCTDISGTKSAQEAADRSRRELDAILHGVAEGISAMDPKGNFIYANPRYAEMAGFPNPAALIASTSDQRRGMYELRDEDGRAVGWSELPGIRVLRGEAHAEKVLAFRNLVTGITRWINAKSTSLRGPDGGLLMVINFAQDITAMHAVQEEIYRSREQLSTILSGIAEAIIACDGSGRTIYANEAAARLMDRASPDDLIRDFPEAIPKSGGYGSLLHDERGNPVSPESMPLRMALEGKEVPPALVRFRPGPKARERWIITRAKPIFGKEGKVSLVIGMTQDITELREKEEAMSRLQKMESLGKLAGGIAHDFNNLLVSINGFSQIGLEEARGRKPLEDCFREILRSGQRAASLTQQLLAYSRRQMVETRPLCLNDVVRDMEKMLRRLIGEDIKIHSRLAEPLPPVEADSGQLEQVILNLVVNARDAMPTGGELVLETFTSRLEDRDLAGNPDAKPGEFVSLRVTDSGVGMSPEVMERIFEPFYTTKEVGKGTGLGLSSVYGIVKQASGHIEVKSEPGAGSTFTIHYPASRAPRRPSPAPAGAKAKPKTAGTILLVEDEDSVRNFTRLVLESRGYRVIPARNGREALGIAQGLPELDVLLSDVVMPHMRGTALMEEVRKLHPGVGVILMSGYLEEGKEVLGKGGGPDHFLQKPFQQEDLFAKVEGSLKRKAG